MTILEISRCLAAIIVVGPPIAVAFFIWRWAVRKFGLTRVLIAIALGPTLAFGWFAGNAIHRAIKP